MKFNEWTKRKSKNIDNDELSGFELENVLMGEALEASIAFDEFCKKPNVSTLMHFYEEIFDIVQASLNLVRRARRISGKNGLEYNKLMHMAHVEHQQKAIDRGWKVDNTKVIEIEVFDFETYELED